ncbi:hypothetical protein [Staphylococcus epidermidis]|uniref:hypothetical protein n=1 Tax=Staphylococcus epidermidis TaxID=1282 RepID=UPI0011A143BD|nr:hypothetical protein [Staphylococcus epidermidis]MBM0749688.1 hypothetical protein [Staphylococcus epidermidis]
MNNELIVMLTYNDVTVKNASQIFEECKQSNVKFWGFKDSGIPLDEMKKLFSYMKENNKTTVLEVVEYTEEEGLKGAKIALECGCDILMGTVFFDSINKFCKENGLKYMPFVGNVYNRPSVLEGTVESMISQANDYLSKGVYGLDLLAYRYVGDVESLIKRLSDEINAPICIAGSINSHERLDYIKTCSPWAFTIVSCFFDNNFDGSFLEQIDKVYKYVKP